MIVYQQWKLWSRMTFLYPYDTFFLMNKVSWRFCRSSAFRRVLGLTEDEGKRSAEVTQLWIRPGPALLNLCRHQTITKSNTYCLYWSALTCYTLWGLSVPSVWAGTRVVCSEEPGLFLVTFSHLLMWLTPQNSLKRRGWSWTLLNKPCAVFTLAWRLRTADLKNMIWQTYTCFFTLRGAPDTPVGMLFCCFFFSVSHPEAIPGVRQLQQSRCNQEGAKSRVQQADSTSYSDHFPQQN